MPTHAREANQMSLLDLERLLQPSTEVITDDASFFEFMCDMGMKWREEHGLPPVDRATAGKLYMTTKRTEEMEYQFP